MTIAGLGGLLSCLSILALGLGNDDDFSEFFTDTVAVNLGLGLLDVACDDGEAVLGDFAGDLAGRPFFLPVMMNDCPCPGLRGFTRREKVRL